MELESKIDSKFVAWFKTNFTTRTITINALIASAYVVVTILCGPLSYEFAQFRFSELLNLFVFFNPSYTLGLTIGCLIANLASTNGVYDIVFGTLATLVSCLLMIGLSKIIKSLLLAGLIPCIINAIVVPFVIYLSCSGTQDAFALETMYWTMFGWVFLGEFVCIICIGYPIMFFLTKKNKSFPAKLGFDRNLDFKW